MRLVSETLEPESVLSEEDPDNEYFGACPRCGDSDRCLNVGRDHWAVCTRHKARWLVGSNLFSGWRHETETDWQRNSELLSGYRIVEPIFFGADVRRARCLHLAPDAKESS